MSEAAHALEMSNDRIEIPLEWRLKPVVESKVSHI